MQVHMNRKAGDIDLDRLDADLTADIDKQLAEGHIDEAEAEQQKALLGGGR